MSKPNKLEDIQNSIEANKEILSTMPQNTPNNIQEYVDKIEIKKARLC